MMTLSFMIFMVGLPTAICFGVAFLQHKKKGPPMINQWFLLGKEGRAKACAEEKAAYYKIGRNVFCGFGIIFAMPASHLIGEWAGLWSTMLVGVVVTLLYGYASSVRVTRKFLK